MCCCPMAVSSTLTTSLAEGPLAEVQANDEVLEVYLGR